MNLLVDIAHPGHVHLLHPLCKELLRRGHTLHYATRHIPVAMRLMEHYGMTPWLDLGQKQDSMAGKAFAVAKQDWQMLRYVQRHHIQLGLGSGITLGHVAQLTSLRSLVFDDDDDAAEPLVVRFGHPFSDVVFTPDCIIRRSKKAVYYTSTHELAYLHPDLFTPDCSVLQRAGLHKGERFFIMRFVAFKGHHDVGQHGLDLEQKKTLIQRLEPHGRVIITSERAVEPEFEQYRLPVPPEDIHSLMAYSSLFLGDSQTMTSEAAVLGVPALKCNTFAGRLAVPNMLEKKYQLCYAYLPSQFDEMLQRLDSLLQLPAEELHALWQQRRQRMLNELINPVPYFLDYIEQHYGLHD